MLGVTHKKTGNKMKCDTWGCAQEAKYLIGADEQPVYQKLYCCKDCLKAFVSSANKILKNEKREK